MNVHIFLQARMGSTRFSGKVLADIGGKTVLERTVERLVLVRRTAKMVLVTSEKPENDTLEAEAQRLRMPVFRGAENNTLDRFYQAAQQFQPDAIVRVTCDCPLIDPELIDEGIRLFQQKNIDFLSDARPFTYPHGMQFEIMRRDALERAWEEEQQRFDSYEAFVQEEMNPSERILNDPAFKKEYLVHEPNLAHIRITVDYPEDLELISKVYELLPEGKRGISSVTALFKEHPELLEINKMHNDYPNRR
jgi:spore coat polysaccharide biosynthesis protein SpsF (cytidylyltransferase family)